MNTLVNMQLEVTMEMNVKFSCIRIAYVILAGS